MRYYCIKSFAKVIFFALILELFRVFKMSFVWGSSGFFFSPTNIIGPLYGLYGGLGCTAMVFIVRDLLRVLFGAGAISMGILSFHIPTLAAAAYWAKKSIWVRLFLPIACIIAFNLHPIGGRAFFYSLYWLIPIGLYFYQQRYQVQSIFFQALGSTFVAHAVGSVFWVYCIPMEPGAFLSLMPIVLIERVVFALGMTGACYFVDYAYYLYTYYSIDLLHYALADQDRNK